jgi:hypothetical protein
LNTKPGAASTPVDGNLPVSVSSSATHVHDGDVVGMRTLPVRKVRAWARAGWIEYPPPFRSGNDLFGYPRALL